jgi:glycosyltransferase involved in cell wall biosynthesis
LNVHQVLVTAVPGDAITNAALELRPLLQKIGPSEIFAHHVHPALAREARNLSKYYAAASAWPANDLLLYHASIGDPVMRRFIGERPERLVLVYHNISPAEPFAPYDPGFAGLLEGGRHDLAMLRDRVVLALCDSAFNAAELVALGYPDVRVTPLIVDPDTLQGVEPDWGTAHHLATRVEGPLAVFVGQILPHKRPELLVQALHALRTYLEPEAQLVLVGRHRLRSFAEAVQQQIVELGLAGVWMTGEVTGPELRAFLDRADLFVTASDHEGFCVPLLEAMSFDLPIVARGTSAVPETLGGAGLVLDPDDGPVVFAEAWAEVIADAGLRAQLVEKGRRRLRDFDPDEARRQMLEHLASVV